MRNTSSHLPIQRFLQEQKALQIIASQGIPNIVEIIEVKIDEDHVANSYIKMKKYDGSLYNLFYITKGNVKLSLQLILPIIKALKRLLENEPKIIHRDLKPDNILYLNNNGAFELYLTDFGICYLFDDNERLTPTHMAVGARMFLAPEYEIGRVENITEKGDIYSLGKIIWCMINGDVQMLLPSNFWFVDSFDLQKIFPSNHDMINANLVIASCLNIEPDKRINYENLIQLIESILNNTGNGQTREKILKVKLFQEKRNIEFVEILKKNKLMVNRFSALFLDVLKDINMVYSSFKLTEKVLAEYSKRTSDGVDFTTTNVDNCTAHYLYSASYDNIYLSINYNPPSKGEIYANITFSYNVHSSQKSGNIKIKYDTNNSLIMEFKSHTSPLSKNELMSFVDQLVTDYCES